MSRYRDDINKQELTVVDYDDYKNIIDDIENKVNDALSLLEDLDYDCLHDYQDELEKATDILNKLSSELY